MKGAFMPVTQTMPRNLLSRLGRRGQPVQTSFGSSDYVNLLRNPREARTAEQPLALQQLVVDELSRTNLVQVRLNG